MMLWLLLFPIHIFISVVSTLYSRLLSYFSLPRSPDLWHFSSLTIGHRGCRNTGFNIPENSLLAMEYARRHGAAGIEVDCMLTADEEIVVIHDGTLNRTHENTGPVRDFTLKQLQSFRFKHIPNTRPHQLGKFEWPESMLALNQPTDGCPSLKQVIEYVKHHELKLMIELKEWRNHSLICDKLYALYEQYPYLYYNSYIATFNPFHLYQLRRRYPNLPTCLLYCRDCTEWYNEEGSKEMKLPQLINYRWTRWIFDQLLFQFATSRFGRQMLGLSMIGSHNILVSTEQVVELRTEGIMVDVWTVNGPGEKSFLLELGCLVTTDLLFEPSDDEQRAKIIKLGLRNEIKQAQKALKRSGSSQISIHLEEFVPAIPN